MKFKKLAMGIAILLSTTTFLACGGDTTGKEDVKNPAFNVTITDSSDYTVTIEKKPERIVSLSPSTTEIVAALGAEAKLVGRTEYCSYPEEVQDATTVGGTSTPSLEKIIELKPDLVLASTHAPKEVVEKLRELKIPTIFLNEDDNFDGTYSAIEKTGQLIGEDAKAKEIVDSMKKTKTAVETAVNKEFEGKERPSIYFTNSIGENGDFAAGGDTFISEVLELAGGKNIAGDVEGWSYSKEKIVENDPDIIIVPGGVGIKEDLAKLPVYKDLTAVKEGNVYEVNQDEISRQGPRVVNALEDIAIIISPELEYEKN